MHAKQKIYLENDKSNPRRFYVYYHADPEGNIFYIGKGCGKRIYDISSRSKSWKEYAMKFEEGYGACYLAIGLTEKDALKVEIECIKQAKKEGMPLVNKTKGGETRSFRGLIYCYQNGRIYNTSKEAADDLGVSSSKVRECCCGGIIHTKGYEFCRVDNIESTSSLGIRRRINVKKRMLQLRKSKIKKGRDYIVINKKTNEKEYINNLKNFSKSKNISYYVLIDTVRGRRTSISDELDIIHTHKKLKKV